MPRINDFQKIYDNEDFQKPVQKDYPYIVDIELTNNCNLKCMFCLGARASSRKRGFIKEGLFKKVVDDCAENKIPVRFIRWGEPFLHPDIIKFCKYVKKAGLPLHITNNGLMIKEKQMKELVKLEVDSLIFSMQGATKEQYAAMRDTDRYDDFIANVKKMVEIRGKAKKPFIRITSTMMRDTEEEIAAFKRFWEKIVDDVGIGKTIPFWNPAVVTKILQKKYTPCKEVHRLMGVDWDGKATACCGDHDNLLTIGNIKRSSIKSLWNNERINAIRTILDNKGHRALTKCSTCSRAYDL